MILSLVNLMVSVVGLSVVLGGGGAQVILSLVNLRISVGWLSAVLGGEELRRFYP